jgi:hypothetical protein
MHRCARCASLYPSLALGLVTTRTCIKRYGGDVKENPPNMSRLVIDISYAAPQVHEIVNVALHREYHLGIVFI